MCQITLYLDDEIASRMKRAAEAEGLSQSQWVSRLIREKTAREWPHHVAEMAGTWRDMPTVEQIRNNEVEDGSRESFWIRDGRW
jgi:hypothetical protein